jgi:DNA repair exonuclease SbcCD ATPase subunit
MKILDLTIENIRGIRSTIPLEPDRQNLVIFGPNGTGKSAVVDAIDFLFTGDISRLAGRGSWGMSLKDHGKHIDADIGDAHVKATIEVEGVRKPVIIERWMKDPKKISCSEKSDPVKEALAIAGKGQYVLSRSEILKYIAAEAGKRAEEIQAILNLDKIEDIRKTLGTISREADRTKQADSSTLEKSKSAVCSVLGLSHFSEKATLEKINAHRQILKGEAIKSLKGVKIKEDVTRQETKNGVNKERSSNTLRAIQKILTDKGQEIFDTEAGLRATVQKLKNDVRLKRDLSNKRLLDLGISLIDESGSCPLCLTSWQPGKLKELLQERVLRATEAAEIENSIKEFASKNDTVISVLQGHVDTLAKDAKDLGESVVEIALTDWSKSLSAWLEQLRNATDDYETTEPTEQIKAFLRDDKWESHSEVLGKKIGSLEEATPEQKAWDALTGLEPVLKRYLEDTSQFERSSGFANAARILSDSYSQTKDAVLENLFNSVNDDFESYYKFLHGEDEKSFESEIKPEGSKLDFKVDFYGRGKHHPRALHSEGHQDSMGLCLYMALNKKISEGKVKLVVLDDVVMSIDSEHRRNFCKLLHKYFSDLQFIITTHNRTWARQLCTDAVVRRKNLIEFKGWSVESGPKYSDKLGIWDEIKKKVHENQISSAAHQLREHLEFLFESVCDSLRGRICYRSDGRYELGDYIDGAKNAYKAFLRQAKSVANSWDNRGALDDLTKIETQINEVINRTQMEHWGINENVHYNKWADFSKDDFLPIVEAFQDFESFYRCQRCSGLISLMTKGEVESCIKCPCGEVTWNLERKGK